MCKKEAALLILSTFKHNHSYYAHNLLFDFLMILEGLIHFNVKFNWIFIDYLLYGVKIIYKEKIFKLKCSYKLIPKPLKDFYPFISSFKKMYFPYYLLNTWNPDLLCSIDNNIDKIYENITLDEYLKIYALNDSYILLDGILNFWKNLKKIGIEYNENIYTCGAISLKYYIKYWNLINLNLDKNIIKQIRKSYYGGRCEVFGNSYKNEKIYHYDFPGMYQQCMLEKLPYDNYEFVVLNNSSYIDYPGFYYIKINYIANLPVLPIKTDKLYFKEGYVEGWYWWEEINLTIKSNKILNLNILYGILCHSYDYILKEFIDKLNKIKLQGGIMKDIGKLLINSFYGRMAINEKMNIIKLSLTKDKKIYGIIGNYYITKVEKKKKIKSNIAISSAITSKSRIKLYNEFSNVINNKGKLLYCDTDSIFATFPIIENMSATKINFDKNIKDAVFIGPKSYGILFNNKEEIIKIKGFNNIKLKFKTIKLKFYNKKILESNTILFTKKNLNINIINKWKYMKTDNYNKRIWKKNFKNTIPYKSTPY